MTKFIRNIIIVSILFITSNLLGESHQINWSHKSGSELYLSSQFGIIDFSIIAADGSINFADSKQEWSLNYINRFDYHNILGLLSFNGFGGRYQYNKIPHMVIGIKGTLNNNRFVEVYNNWFSRFEIEDPIMRKSGRYKSDINYGIKNYYDIFFKPLDGFTWGFWNYITIGENQFKSPILLQNISTELARDNLSVNSFESPESTIQITPRVIYELKGNYNRFVAELYMDNRFYLLDSVDINNQDYRYFFKIVAAPQWIVDWKGKHSQFYMYSAATAEIMQYLGYVQWIVKTSPKVDWDFNRFHFGLSGAGYDFLDEIGIVFDNNELLAFKNAGSHSAFIFAVKGYLSFDIFPFLYVGVEPSYGGGLVIDGSNQFFMDELTFSVFLQTDLEISDKWKISLRSSGKFIYYSSILNATDPLPNENIFHLSLQISR